MDLIYHLATIFVKAYNCSSSKRSETQRVPGIQLRQMFKWDENTQKGIKPGTGELINNRNMINKR